jgi:hypothetical protein
MQAQQRYRERRKQKFSEMEQSLHRLASQVEQMSNVQSQNNMLQVHSVHALSMPLFQASPAESVQIGKFSLKWAANKQQLAHEVLQYYHCAKCYPTEVISGIQGKAVELESRLRDKELEVEQLRKALAHAGVKQEVVASPDDHVSMPFLRRKESPGLRKG